MTKGIEIALDDKTLFKIKQTNNGKETYLIFPIPGLGTHISLHRSGKMHIKDKDITKDISIPYKSINEFCADFKDFIYIPKQEVVCIRYKINRNITNKKKINLLDLPNCINIIDAQIYNAYDALKLLQNQHKIGVQIIDLLNKRVIPQPIADKFFA